MPQGRAGIAISTRSTDVRAAQQLAVLASLPPLGIVALMTFNVIVPTLGPALGLAAALLIGIVAYSADANCRKVVFALAGGCGCCASATTRASRPASRNRCLQRAR